MTSPLYVERDYISRWCFAYLAAAQTTQCCVEFLCKFVSLLKFVKTLLFLIKFKIHDITQFKKYFNNIRLYSFRNQIKQIFFQILEYNFLTFYSYKNNPGKVVKVVYFVVIKNICKATKWDNRYNIIIILVQSNYVLVFGIIQSRCIIL